MQIKSIKQHPGLHIVHQSELIAMQKQLDLMKQQIRRLTSMLVSTEVVDIKQHANKTIRLPTNRGFEWIATDQIIYCEAQGNYCKIYTEDSGEENNTKTYIVSKSLKSFAAQLPSTFIRCHQSYLINKIYVVRSYSKDGVWLTMRNQKNIPVSRRRKHVLTTIAY